MSRRWILRGITIRRLARCGAPLLGAVALSACGGGDPLASDLATSSESTGQGGASSDGTSVTTGGTGGSGFNLPKALPLGRFRIGEWCGLPENELNATRMAQLANAGFTVASFGCDGHTETVDYNTTMVALANAVGMEGMVDDLRLGPALEGQDVDATLDAITQDYKDLPGMAGYFVIDEPTGPFTKLAAVVNGLQTRDPAHYAYVNLLPVYATGAQLGFPSYESYVSGYFSAANPKLISVDDYPFLIGKNDSTFFTDLGTLRAHAVAAGIPFGQYIQSVSFAGHRATSLVEKLWEGTQTLAYGGSGVSYFTYWTLASHWGFGDGLIDYAGNETNQYGDSKYVNARLQAYGRYLVAAKSTSVFHNGALPTGTSTRVPGSSVYMPNAIPMTVGQFDVNDDQYAFLANRDYSKAVETDVFVPHGGAPELLDVDTGEFAPIAVLATDPEKGQKIHLSIAAGDGALLHLIGPVPLGAPGAEAFVGTVRGDTATFDIVDSSFGDSYLGSEWWHTCPEGYEEAGSFVTPTGFWVCTRKDLHDRTFYLGNVVANQAVEYKLSGGSATSIGANGWNTCPTGKLVGRRFEVNGYWLCME